MKNWIWKIWAVAILPAITVAAQPVLLYNNTTTLANYNLMFPNSLEVGDQIWLANYLANPYLTSFSFEYYSPNATFSGTVTADVRFYLNDGAPFNSYATPGTLFYDTGPFDIPTPESATSENSAVLSFSTADLYSDALMNMNPNLQMPDNFTFSVTFQGLSGPDQVGLPSFEPPTVGYNKQDYWENDGGTWKLETNTVDNVLQPVAYGIQLYGTNQPPTPEPTTLCLTAAGAALLAGFARRRRQ
jgi:hypothetical protein